MDVPAETPVQAPVEEPIAATAALVVVQDPPVKGATNVPDDPLHNDIVPVRGPGNADIVTTTEIAAIAGGVYMIVAVPGVIPLTIPEVSPTVAVAGLELVQVPPEGLPVSGEPEFMQILVTPVIVCPFAR